MFKKIALTTAAVSLLASSAFAGEINLFGASAQYKFWSGAASTFLSAQPGCGTVNTAKSGKNFIAVCSSSGDTIRVSESKSAEGVNSVQGLLTTGSTNTCTQGDSHRTMAASIDFNSTPNEDGHYTANSVVLTLTSVLPTSPPATF